MLKAKLAFRWRPRPAAKGKAPNLLSPPSIATLSSAARQMPRTRKGSQAPPDPQARTWLKSLRKFWWRRRGNSTKTNQQKLDVAVRAEQRNFECQIRKKTGALKFWQDSKKVDRVGRTTGWRNYAPKQTCWSFDWSVENYLYIF